MPWGNNVILSREIHEITKYLFFFNIANLFTTNSTYSSRLTTISSRFNRNNSTNGNYYYEAILVTVSIAGLYRFRSVSDIDTYAYLYNRSFLPLSPSMNLIVQNDDGVNTNQFQFTISLQPNVRYILVTTTYNENVIGSFNVIVSGQVRVNLERLNITGITSATTTQATNRFSTSNCK